MIKNRHIPSEKPRFHSVGRKRRSIEDPHVQDLKRDRMIRNLRREIMGRDA